MLRWSCAYDTHPGARRNANEDAVLARPDVGLWAVADGMGGHAAGDVASRSITDALSLLHPRDSLSGMVDAVEDLLTSVNAKLRSHARECCNGRTVGSTVVTMLADGAVGVALWAGDSRLYRLRGDVLEQVTRDHNPIAEMLDDGLITESTALKADTNIVTRAVGGQNALYLDVAVFDIRPWDTYLLCSDGLYRELSHEELGALLADDSVERSARQLLQASLDRGARDNVSLIVSRTEC